MALNYSHRPMFPAHVSEDNLVSPVRIVNGYVVEGVPDKNGEGYSRPWHASQGEVEEWNFSCRRDRVDCCRSPESTSKDIVDLLPSDPFGMDMETTFTAITGWLQDLEVDYGGYLRCDNGTASPDEYGLFAGWNFIWNNAMKFQQFPSNIQFNENLNVGIQSVPSSFQVFEKPHIGFPSFPSTAQYAEESNMVSKTNQFGEDTVMGGPLAPCEFGSKPACNVLGFGNVGTSCSSELQFGGKVEGTSNGKGVPHEAFAFALGYLGVKDLLSVESVCRSLCSTVRGDPLLWMSFHIDQPLNDKITDDILVQLASRAQGNLQCLSLVDCPRVTDDGLRRVLETNPRLTKLSVPGCTRLSVEGIVNTIKMYNSNKDARGVKHVRIGGIYGVTREHFDDLKWLLGDDALESSCRPRFYHRGNFYLPCDDDRAIDIEMCPRCEKFRLVYDCPAEGCQVKDKAAEVCRGCKLCIPRCAQCGRCTIDTEYEETFCLQLLCSDCLKHQDKLDRSGDPCGAQNKPRFVFSTHG